MYNCIIGPMRSGKTTILKQVIGEPNLNIHRKCHVYDGLNTRKSDRDLNISRQDVIMYSDFQEPEDASDDDIFIFDEVHFVNVFKKEKPFLDLLGALPVYAEYYFSGIYFDFYHNYEVFPVWLDLIDTAKELGHEIGFEHLRSLGSCHFCGGNSKVFYTANISKSQERVGDHYVNVCYNCKGKALSK